MIVQILNTIFPLQVKFSTSFFFFVLFNKSAPVQVNYKYWTGLVKRILVKRGFVKRGFVKCGLLKRGQVKRGLGKICSKPDMY